jgi:HEAT repeat protein
MSIDTILAGLRDPAKPVSATELTGLSGLSDDERRAFGQSWPSLPVERRRQVVGELSSLTEDNVELDFDAIFLDTLTDEDAEVRVASVRGLWEYSGRDAIPGLLSLLGDDPNAAVRSEAALALGRYVLAGEFDEARPRDVEEVTDALRRTAADPTEPPEVRGRAVESLGASSRPWARDVIHNAYDSGDPRLVTSAIHAMGRSADNYWIATLIDELQSDDAEIRYEAATACGMIEDEEAVPYLIDLLADDDAEVREQAIVALGAIGGDDAIEALREQATSEDERMREAALQSLDEAEFGDDPLGFRG